MLRRERPEGSPDRVVGLLDVGTSKIACLIAQAQSRGRDPAPRARVLGLGHQRSRGVKGGVIVDLDEAEQSIRATLAQAERMAGTTLDEVYVSVSCGRLRSLNFAANVDVESGVVTGSDIARVLAGGRAYAEREGRMLVHMNRVGFRLDGIAGFHDPRGMAAHRLSVDLHAVTADEAPVRNLLMVVERCFLSVAGLVAAPYASALSATSNEERRLGVTCIDIGGGTATIAVFSEGRFLYADAVPVGGNHVTLDIARALQTPLAEAERIKALYGTLVSAQSDEHEVFSYPLAGEEDGAVHQTTKARLAEVIRPRVAGLLGLIEERLARGGIGPYAGERVVLTGGASQLVGMGEFAANALGRPVRVARPHQPAGLAQGVASPAFSTLAGLFVSAVAGGGDMITYRDASADSAGYLGRVGQWLMNGF